MTDQIPLFIDTYDEAIRHTVNALGGMKRVGVELWPDKSADAAGRRLADCLNGDKPDRLNPSELALIRRKARAAGIHVLAAYEARDAGYADPQPIEPEDERAALMREFVLASKAFANLLTRCDRAGLRVAA
jgi:hypothetical protein